jgi:hypothetical protein
MANRYFMNGLSAAQYLSYLIVGAVYFSVFASMAGAVTLTSFITLGAVIVPLLLGGYVSALSLIVPRAAAVVAFVCTVPYLLLGISVRITVQANSFFVIPSGLIVVVSVVAFFWSEGSVWRRLTTRLAKVAIVVLATLPAAFATWWLGSFLLGFASAYLRRST